jgi:LacI family transcriptional regulator
MNRSARLPTIKDVARMAGVSYQTVSNVINGEARVTDETRGRVQTAIEQLGYQPHAAARTLRSGRSRILGLMIPDTQNPHFWATVAGAEDEALQNGYNLLLATASMDLAREEQAFEALIQQNLDGIIPLLTYPENLVDSLRDLRRRNIPIALSASGAFMPDIEIDIVQMHFEDAARELMEHLLDLGHRRIGVIWGVGRSELANDRVTAYKQGLEAAGISFDPRYLIVCHHNLRDGYHAAEQLLDLDPRPTALIGINDLMAFGAMQASLRRGLKIPQDISIAGFDDVPMSSLLSPPLTTGRADGAEIGRQCVRLLLERIRNPERPPQRIHLPTRLIVRGSTGPSPDTAGRAGG